MAIGRMSLLAVGSEAILGASVSYLWWTRFFVAFAGSAGGRTPLTVRLGFVALDFPASEWQRCIRNQSVVSMVIGITDRHVKHPVRTRLMAFFWSLSSLELQSVETFTDISNRTLRTRITEKRVCRSIWLKVDDNRRCLLPLTLKLSEKRSRVGNYSQCPVLTYRDQKLVPLTPLAFFPGVLLPRVEKENNVRAVAFI
jgi:hypothetical protein